MRYLLLLVIFLAISKGSSYADPHSASDEGPVYLEDDGDDRQDYSSAETVSPAKSCQNFSTPYFPSKVSDSLPIAAAPVEEVRSLNSTIDHQIGGWVASGKYKSGFYREPATGTIFVGMFYRGQYKLSAAWQPYMKIELPFMKLTSGVNFLRGSHNFNLGMGVEMRQAYAEAGWIHKFKWLESVSQFETSLNRFDQLRLGGQFVFIPFSAPRFREYVPFAEFLQFGIVDHELIGLGHDATGRYYAERGVLIGLRMGEVTLAYQALKDNRLNNQGTFSVLAEF